MIRLTIGKDSERIESKTIMINALLYLGLILGWSILLSTSNSMVTTADAATYYIDATGGDDRNDGLSESTPWKTASKIGFPNFLNPGDEVLFKRGEVWHDKRISIWSSGTEAAPIVLDCYGDPADPPPLIDGTYQGEIVWEHVSGNIYRTTQPSWPADPGLLIYNGVCRPSISTIRIASDVSFIKPGDVLMQRSPTYCTFQVTAVDVANHMLSGVTFQRGDNDWAANARIEVIQVDENGEEVSPRPFIYISWEGGLIPYSEGLSRLGDWYWDETEHALYLYSDVLPDSDLVTVAEGNLFGHDKRYGIHPFNAMQYITIRNIDFNGFYGAALYFVFGTGIVIENCSILNSGADDITRSAILLTATQKSIIRNCIVESPLRNGISLYCQSPNWDVYTSNDNILEHNTVTNAGSAGISLSPISSSQAHLIVNNIIRFNTIENANSITYDAGGIYLQDTGAGNQIIANTIRKCGTDTLRSAGIMIDKSWNASLTLLNATTIRENLVEENLYYGIAVCGIGHQIIDNTIRFNSTGRKAKGQIVFFPNKNNVSDCTVTGNIIRTDETQTLFKMELNASAYDQHYIDNNIYEIVSGTGIDIDIDAFEFSTNNRASFNNWKMMFCNGIQPPCRDAASTLNIFYDYDRDHDTDGQDLAFLVNNYSPEMLSDFVAGFGNIY